jgi:hypothetical protein
VSTEITYRRTRNYDVLTRMARTPELYRQMGDDSAPPRDEYHVLRDERIVYVLAMDGDEPLGFFMLVPESRVMAKFHSIILPSAWGPRALAAIKGLFEWTWRETQFQRLITDVPEFNRAALSFGKRAGLTQYGYNEASFLKGGKMIGQYNLAISRPEAI